MLSNVTHSHFYCECNKERGPIDQLYIELGLHPGFSMEKNHLSPGVIEPMIPCTRQK